MSQLACSSHIYKDISLHGKKKIQEVCRFASEHLSDLHRRTGESYAQHGCEVALTLKECCTDPSLLRVAMLHDLLVHPDGKKLLKKSPLTTEERSLVQQMHDLRRLHIDKDTEDLDYFIDSLLEDSRLLPLRMAHRLNDVRNLDQFTPALRQQIANETLHMYTAIAGRLGMDAWRYEMEDICFRILQPEITERLEKQFQLYQKLDETCLSHTAKLLKQKIQDQGIECDIQQRVKAVYSTYRKMVLKERAFEKLTDRLALRIIVEKPTDCYLALAVVNSVMHPIPGKLKDYIGAPKENGYRSIHSVVYPLPGVTEQPMEIQIRTLQMHQICEYGVAAHSEYKNVLYAMNANGARVDLFRNLERIREEARSPEQFESALRNYFREDRIAVFDSKNNLYHLKSPVTALDFVHHIYPNRFSKLKKVRVNGRNHPLSTELHDGDTLEAIFGRENCVQEEWIHDCLNASTKKNIKNSLRTLQNKNMVKK
ncbi:MAG: HD domain-containing protein [bacterium]|nr:HD domain-containing protein [bacterium]